MAQTITQTQTPTKKEVLFWKIWKIKARGEETRYKAWVDRYFVRGITKGGREAVKEVVNRMAAAQNDLIDRLKLLVDQVVDNVVAASKSASLDIVVYMGTDFHLGEYMGIKVTLQRVKHPRATARWCGRIDVVFKGADGHMALSKHIVGRAVEFYTDIVPRDKLYSVIYEAARIAFNAYFRVFRSTSQ